MKRTKRARVLLDPANPHEFAEAELVEAEKDVRAQWPAPVDVLPAIRDEEGYGGPLSEVLHVWLDVAESVNAVAFAAAVAKGIGVFLRRRWEADKATCDEGETPRKRVGTLYGPNDQILSEVVVDAPEGEPMYLDPPAGNQELPHPRPKETSVRPDEA
jgi:hypothetical protein